MRGATIVLLVFCALSFVACAAAVASFYTTHVADTGGSVTALLMLAIAFVTAIFTAVFGVAAALVHVRSRSEPRR